MSHSEERKELCTCEASLRKQGGHKNETRLLVIIEEFVGSMCK
jgi:hypothetical protein